MPYPHPPSLSLPAATPLPTTRLKEMRGQPIGRVRYVAVSATVPNLQVGGRVDGGRRIRVWLGILPSNQPNQVGPSPAIADSSPLLSPILRTWRTGWARRRRASRPLVGGVGFESVANASTECLAAGWENRCNQTWLTALAALNPPTPSLPPFRRGDAACQAADSGTWLPAHQDGCVRGGLAGGRAARVREPLRQALLLHCKHACRLPLAARVHPLWSHPPSHLQTSCLSAA